MKVGLALSGGGVRGASHLGIVSALQMKGIKFDVYAGTSAGSIVATLLALGYSPEYALELFKEGNEKLVDVAYGHILGSLFTNKHVMGIAKGDSLEKTLEKSFKGKYLSDVLPPLGIVATDIITGRQVVFVNQWKTAERSQILDDNALIEFTILDKLSKVVRASCSLPAVFLPVEHDDMLLVDGGITNNLPSDVAYSLGADKVIAIDLGYSGQAKKVDSVFDIAGQSINILMERVTDSHIENGKFKGIYLNPEIYNVSALDTNKIDECFERGFEYGKRIADDVLKQLEN